MLVVLDTNVLVSALWSKDGDPAKILSLVFINDQRYGWVQLDGQEVG